MFCDTARVQIRPPFFRGETHLRSAILPLVLKDVMDLVAKELHLTEPLIHVSKVVIGRAHPYSLLPSREHGSVLVVLAGALTISSTTV